MYPMNMNDNIQRNPVLSSYKTKKQYLDHDMHHHQNHNIFDGKHYDTASLKRMEGIHTGV